MKKKKWKNPIEFWTVNAEQRIYNDLFYIKIIGNEIENLHFCSGYEEKKMFNFANNYYVFKKNNIDIIIGIAKSIPFFNFCE